MLRLIQSGFLIFICFQPAIAGQYNDLLWEDLIPASEREIMLEMMELTRNPHGIPVDPDKDLNEQLNRVFDLTQDPDYQGLMNSINVRAELDQQDIRLPGFIVPLEMNEENAIVEFFLVPYYGACIHVPPPPPNQIVFVRYEKGLQLQEIWKPFYVSGRIFTELHEDDIAVTAYTMAAVDIAEYMEN
jgi:hypothetical protein